QHLRQRHEHRGRVRRRQRLDPHAVGRDHSRGDPRRPRRRRNRVRGSGDAFIFGDAGSDYIEASGSGTVVIRGGDEASTPTDVQGDYIVHSGTGFAVIDAGDGDDRVFGGSPSDIIVGNGGNDHITGPAAVIYGDFAPTEYSVSVLNQTITFPNQGIAGDDLIVL